MQVIHLFNTTQVSANVMDGANSDIDASVAMLYPF